MPAVDLDPPSKATREVHFAVDFDAEAPKSRAEWKAALSPVLQSAPAELVSARYPDEPASRMRVRVPLLSLAGEYALSGPSAKLLREALDQVSNGGQIAVHPTLSFEQALSNAKDLYQLVLGRNAHVSYFVRPNKRLLRAGRFSMKAVFDALLSLGFVWGNGDLFYWPESEDSGQIVVFTSTDPGYFLPEAAAAGEHVADLCFDSYVPWCANPLGTHDAMVAAVRHVCLKLGGHPGGAGDEAYDPDSDRRAIERIGEALGKAGLPPGSAAAHVVF